MITTRSFVMLALATTLLPALCWADVTVEDAWARATPPGAKTAAIYLTLNNGGEDTALVAASTSFADKTELHTHVHADGMMRMEEVPAIDLPSGGTAVLKPHGDHLMLFGLRQGLEPGATVDLELTLENGRQLKLDVPVRDGRKR
ncbi:MAG: copper chaperone PCu(A)C [Pseudomonadota bacterium]